MYKENLSKEFGSHDSGEFHAQVIEIRRRITEANNETPGFYFAFDFPDFREPVERIVSRNVEAWAYEFLTELRQYNETRATEIHGTFVSGYRPSKSTLSGDYRVVRRDEKVISLKYIVDRYYSGAAHGGRETRVQNFIIKPFHPITLDYLLGGMEQLPRFAEFVRSKLAQQKNYDPRSLSAGTQPEASNFSLFNVEKYGIRFTFSEYQIDCYAAGEQNLFISFYDLKDYVQADILSLLEDGDDL